MLPRWLWISLAAACAALAWAAQRAPAAGAVPSSAAGAFACTLPGLGVASIGEAPAQGPVPGTLGRFRHGRFEVEPLAGFGLEARVLGREDYRFDEGAELAPTDLALGWGRMADPGVYERLSITQSGRWYHYRWGSEGPPLPPQEIVRSSANMHLVPGTPEVAEALARVRAGQQVRLQGWLVEARRDDGYRWRSSLTREDSGDGACELIYVCALELR